MPQTRESPIAAQAPDIAILRQAVTDGPGDAQAHLLLASRLWAQGAQDEALGWFAGAVKLDGAHLQARNNFANALTALGRYDEAIAQYREGLALHPDAVELHYNLGNALLAAGRPDEAGPCFRAALARNPAHAGAHNNLGNTLRAAGELEAAIASYKRTLELRPEYFGSLNNIGSALIALHRPQEALEYLHRSLRAQPDYAEACNNLGGALLALDQPEAAADWFARAIELDPEHVQARFGEGLARLSLGDFARGWPGYEARWHDPAFLKDTPDYARPPWRGNEDVAGRVMLVHAEQGLGDTIQFARYVPLLRAKGARVVLQVQAPLVGLLRHLAEDVLADSEPPPPHDLRCPLLSLPLAFATDTTTIPRDIPYVRADAERVDFWARRLGKRTRRRIGVAWSGSAEHPDDAIRSIAAAKLLTALSRHDVELHAVQKDIRDADMPDASSSRLHGDALTDFAETAALLACLDLVITVDTSVAHLAGAMGVPTWILLQRSADFRWLRNRTDSPWYPSARLFRQTTDGAWDQVIAEVARALEY